MNTSSVAVWQNRAEGTNESSIDNAGTGLPMSTRVLSAHLRSAVAFREQEQVNAQEGREGNPLLVQDELLSAPELRASRAFCLRPLPACVCPNIGRLMQVAAITIVPEAVSPPLG